MWFSVHARVLQAIRPGDWAAVVAITFTEIEQRWASPCMTARLLGLYPGMTARLLGLYPGMAARLLDLLLPKCDRNHLDT